MHTDSVWISSPQFVAEQLSAGALAEITVVDSTRSSYTDICEVRRAGCTPSPAANAIATFVKDFFIDSTPKNFT